LERGRGRKIEGGREMKARREMEGETRSKTSI
jgi:hypothetical protein